MNNPNIMIVGCGPHARRIYLPALKKFENSFNLKVKVVVELKEKRQETQELIENFFKDTECFFIEKFESYYTHSLPKDIENELNKLVKEKEINTVIISTSPTNHMQYALWAQRQNLHILMDKPISTYCNIANNREQAIQLKKDYELLMNNYNNKKAFIINAQRRFLPQFEIVQNLINEIAEKFGMPITSIQSTHSDGQWRLPNEILSIKYHPSIGWGKISHSGYHFIDMASKLVKDSYLYAGKRFNEISVFSKFIKPSGVLKTQNQKDLEKIFGNNYKKIEIRTDNELIELYKKNNEAEIDVSSIITLSCDGIPTTNITLNLLHNGFSRRSWMLPNMNDLYKGNGRVRHEYHNIEQGCLQNIQIHSYQSKDNHDINTEEDFLVGGNNHYDIYVFRNAEITGGKVLEVITAKEIADMYKLDKNKVMNELARYEAVKQLLEVVIGNRKANDTKGNIKDQRISVELMSMMYESGIEHKEIIEKIHWEEEHE